MKTFSLIFLFLAILMSIGLNSCKVNDIITAQNDTYPSHRGLYVDKFQYILGDTLLENEVLRYAKLHDFNDLSLYGLWQVTNKPNKYPSLAKFINKAKTEFGIISITATHSTTKAFDDCVTFNNSRNTIFEKFDVLSLENEWWQANPLCDFKCSQEIMSHISDLKYKNKDSLQTEVYIGWLNSKGNDYEEAKFLVDKLDKIAVHCYDTSPNFAYSKDRLITLAKAAKVLNKKPEITIIFSAEKEFMFDYFSKNIGKHDFENAYTTFMKELKTIEPSITMHLNVSGYKIFTYSKAKLAR